MRRFASLKKQNWDEPIRSEDGTGESEGGSKVVHSPRTGHGVGLRPKMQTEQKPAGCRAKHGESSEVSEGKGKVRDQDQKTEQR
jgi:hypothetical protein